MPAIEVTDLSPSPYKVKIRKTRGTRDDVRDLV